MNRQAVGDDDRGSALEEADQGLLDQRLGFAIDAGGGFVEDEVARVMGEGAGES
ncbi:MAG: hypothetical protein R2762_06145 [Bryobacteraceae bacterium]